MLVLHSHWRPPQDAEDEGALLIWAEQSERAAASTLPEAHPFAAERGRLIDQLVESGAASPQWMSGAWEEILLLRLPSIGGRPQASPWLLRAPRMVAVGDEAEGVASFSEAHSNADTDFALQAEEIEDPQDHRGLRPSLETWAVDALCLEPAEGIAFLTALPPNDALPPSLQLGDDLRFWRASAMLLLEVLSLQKLLPGLVALPGPVWQARWLPVLDGEEDGRRLARLSDAMPAICRADAGLETAPAPRDLIESFLSACTDALVRRSMRMALDAGEQRAPSGQGAPSAWLRSLLEGPASIATSPARADHLQRAHFAWLQGLRLAGNKSARVAFRLQSPGRDDGAEEPWRLHFLLQARDDPSLLLGADAVWSAGSQGISAFGQRFERPEELLLAGLGYASRFAPSIRAALRKKRPASARMSAEDAFDFLKYAAPLLEQSGFGILVPPWWNRPGSRLGLKLKVKRQASLSSSEAQPSFGLEELAQFDWQLSLGGEPLSDEEFEALVALKTPLVKVRGEWVQLDPFQVDAALRFWKRREESPTLLDALAYGLGAVEELDGLPIDDVELSEELGQWVARLEGEVALEAVAPPAGLHAQLRPYQQRGLNWLAFLQKSGLGGILADDMGLGKTIQTLSLILHLKETGRLDGPVLLVCPTSVVTNWARECARFTPALELYAHQGKERQQDETFAATAGRVSIVATSFALLRRDVELFEARGWSGIVVDEAQNIKNPDTQQARAIRRMRSEWRLALTGTPVENSLGELWSILSFATPGHLGKRVQFRREMAIPIERHGDERALRRLRRLTRPLILRRLKTDPEVAPDLPGKVETEVYCKLTKEQASLYASVIEDAMSEVEESEGIERRGRVLSMLTRLKQICNHPAQFLGENSAAPSALDARRSGKLGRLNELVDEATKGGEAVLIFSQYAGMGRILRAFLQDRLGREVLFLHGGLSPKQRQRLVDRFQEPGGPMVFVLSLKAAGTGINLTRASQVFHYDRWWNPAVEDQATDRAYRIGQTRSVTVHKFVCLGTLEERIAEMIERKRGLAERAVGAGEDWLGDLSNADIQALVALREEAFE